MSRRPIGAPIAGLRANTPSRRQLIVASTVVGTMASASSRPDPAIHACRAWQDLLSVHDDLVSRWQTLEQRLIRDRKWRALSRRQRAAAPEAAELDAIDDRLDEIRDEMQRLLSGLVRLSATTPRGLAAKLGVAASIVHRHENAEAHDLIASALRDVREMATLAQ